MILLKNAHLYDPADKGLNDILICNDRVIEISPSLEIQVPNLEIVDLQGAITIPGLIDQHVHILGGGGEKGFSSRVPEIQLSHCIHSGVTTLEIGRAHV